MTKHFFLPGMKDLPQENTQLGNAEVAAGAVTDAEAGLAARTTAGVAAIIPPAMSAIGVMIASGRCRVGLSPRWLTRKMRSSRRVSKPLLCVANSAHFWARSNPADGTDD